MLIVRLVNHVLLPYRRTDRIYSEQNDHMGVQFPTDMRERETEHNVLHT